MNAFETFYVKPAENELIETVVHIRADPRPALLGSVIGDDGKPVESALIAVYEAGGSTAPDTPVGSLYTDEFGQFAFGPLSPGKLYLVRVYKNSGKPRTLELTEP